VIDEHEVDAFLARSPAEERERLALWPAAGTPAPDPASHAGRRDDASTHADTQFLERCCERALARRSAGPGRAALFVDRDGTLIAERHHLADPAGVQLLPGVAEALRSARALGHPVVVVSNQAGVGRGQFPESVVHAVMARLRRLLRAEGVELDAIRHCPHAPEAGCDCRKPGARLLREAAEDLRLSLRDSVMVGDKWIDVEAGQAAGGAGVLVRTGHGIAELSLERGPGGRPPELVCEDLPAAVRWFLARQP
jgi:histidinol-phosphate phosphatase family protein